MHDLQLSLSYLHLNARFLSYIARHSTLDRRDVLHALDDDQDVPFSCLEAMRTPQLLGCQAVQICRRTSRALGASFQVQSRFPKL